MAQAGDTLLQLGLLRSRRQRNDQALQYSEKLQLFAVFAGVDNLTIGYSGRVVSPQIAEQMQGLRRALNGLGHDSQAAQRQHRQQQPTEVTQYGSHIGADPKYE